MQTPEGLRRATRPQAPAAEPVGPGEDAIDESGEQAGEHVHLPPQSVWPMTVAGGVTMGFLGIVTNYALSVVGVVIMIWGLYAWVQELRHELH
jgi:hypothetical protein